LKNKSKRSLLISLLCVVVVVAIAVPVLAYAPVDVEGFYMAKAPRSVYDTNGVRYTFSQTYWPYFGFWLEQTDEVLTGYLFGFNATSVNGCRVTGGSYTYNATMSPKNSKALSYGVTNITVTATGTLGVYLATGCLAVATNGTGTIVGSPVSCSPGRTTLNVTGAGNITVYTWMDYTFLGDLAGTAGSSRLVLAGPDLKTELDANTATIAGVTGVLPDDTVSFTAPGWVFSVTDNGTAYVDVPTGSLGLAEGTSLLINGGANETLEAGRTISLNLTDAPGTLTITLQTDRIFSASAKVYTSFWSSHRILSGSFGGFLVLDDDPWTAAMLDMQLTAAEMSYIPLLG
jgi:hypothetical protein